jgi:hypothetical protein
MASGKSPLQKIARTLQRNGYDTNLLPAGGSHRVSRLEIGLANDYRDRPQLLYLSLASEAHAALDGQGQSSDVAADAYEEVDYLQFYIQLPFTPPPQSLPRLAQQLHTLNRELPLVGFGLKEDVVFFRYLMMLAGKKIPDRLVYEAVTMIEFILGRSLPMIEETVSGG